MLRPSIDFKVSWELLQLKNNRFNMKAAVSDTFGTLNILKAAAEASQLGSSLELWIWQLALLAKADWFSTAQLDTYTKSQKERVQMWRLSCFCLSTRLTSCCEPPVTSDDAKGTTPLSEQG